MPKPPGYLPIEPDAARSKEPDPHAVDHPVHDEHEEEIDMDDDEDTGADPWWM